MRGGGIGGRCVPLTRSKVVTIMAALPSKLRVVIGRFVIAHMRPLTRTSHASATTRATSEGAVVAPHGGRPVAPVPPVALCHSAAAPGCAWT